MDWVQGVVDCAQGVVDWVQAVVDRVQGMMDEGWRVMVKLRGQAEGQDMVGGFSPRERDGHVIPLAKFARGRVRTYILRTSDIDASIRQNRAVGSRIEGRFDCEATALEDMGVNHCGFYVLVAKQFLHSANIVSIL